MKIIPVTVRILVVLSSCVAVASCSSAADEATAAEAGALQLGDHGPEVREVHDFLMRFGYFPNDELAARYPNFRPHVLERPSDPEEFDEVMEFGVRAYQRFMGLPETGVADSQTRALMAQPRCGNPDISAGNGEKFDVASEPWGSVGQACELRLSNNRYPITFSIDPDIGQAAWNTIGLEFTQAEFKAAIRAAVFGWQVVTSASFREVASNANPCIRFHTPRPLPGFLAFTDRHADSTADIEFNSTGWAPGGPSTPAYPWSAALDPSQVPNTRYDLVMGALHEFGHALRLNHSSVTDSLTGLPSVMYPSGPRGGGQRQLQSDDKIAAHASFHVTVDAFGPFNATSADAGGDATGAIWATDDSFQQRGFNIWNSINGWHKVNDGSQAGQIAVTAGGFAWHVNTDGEVWRRTSRNEAGVWARVPSPVPLGAVAAGPDSKIFALAWAVSRGTQDHDVYWFNGTSFQRLAGAAAMKLTVMRNGSMIHINEAGEMWAADVSSTGVATYRRWLATTSTNPLWANVHAGKDGALFAVDRNNRAYLWNAQSAIPGSAGSDARALNGWRFWENVSVTDIFAGTDSSVFTIQAIKAFKRSF